VAKAPRLLAPRVYQAHLAAKQGNLHVKTAHLARTPLQEQPAVGNVALAPI